MVLLWYLHEISRFSRYIVNRLFEVAKAGRDVGAERSQRCILDARPGNRNIEKAPNPQIPDRGSLGEVLRNKDDN